MLSLPVVFITPTTVVFPSHLGLPLTLFLQVDQQVVEGSTLVAALQGETVSGMASNPTSTPHRGPAYSGQAQHVDYGCGKGHDWSFKQKAADTVKS